jgi:peptidyl-prolyl cis-trans isomerase C
MTTRRAVYRRLAREPLIAFVLLGAVIFAAYAMLGDRAATNAHRLDVSPGDIDRLRVIAVAQNGREADAVQLKSMTDAWVRQEILYREAVASGLDRDDELVRRRMAQKMDFLATLDLREPDDAALRAYYAAHAARYAAPDRVGFTQLYFGRDRQAAQDARARLQDGAPLAAVRSRPFLLAAEWQPQAYEFVARDFGERFAAALAGLTVGSWAGPVESAHGLHVVRVNARLASGPQDFEALRGRVRDDLVAELTVQARDAAYERLRQRYVVNVAPAAP